jgi:hypothetical protein
MFDWIWINTDGAFVVETMTGGWGVVARDGDNDLIVTAAGIMVALYVDRSLFVNGRCTCRLFWLQLCLSSPV